MQINITSTKLVTEKGHLWKRETKHLTKTMKQQQQQQQQIIITIMQILAPTYRTFGISSSKKLLLYENCHSIYFIP